MMTKGNEKGKGQLVTPSPLPALFSNMGLAKVTRNDRFSIDYTDDSLTVTVWRQNGRVDTIRKILGAGFSEVTTVEPENISKEKRNAAILKLLDEGMTQERVARRFGLSQPTISSISNRLRK